MYLWSYILPKYKHEHETYCIDRMKLRGDIWGNDVTKRILHKHDQQRHCNKCKWMVGTALCWWHDKETFQKHFIYL